MSRSGRALRLINQPRICGKAALFLALRRAAFVHIRPCGRGYLAGIAKMVIPHSSLLIPNLLRRGLRPSLDGDRALGLTGIAP